MTVYVCHIYVYMLGFISIAGAVEDVCCNLQCKYGSINPLRYTVASALFWITNSIHFLSGLGSSFR